MRVLSNEQVLEIQQAMKRLRHYAELVQGSREKMDLGFSMFYGPRPTRYGRIDDMLTRVQRLLDAYTDAERLDMLWEKRKPR